MAKSKGKVQWQRDEQIGRRLKNIIKATGMDWIDKTRIYPFRSYNSTTRAYARIWGFSRIFQIALDEDPAYVIEVISEKFDKLNNDEQDKVLIHELVHIPKSFSGSLVPHTKRRRGRPGFEDRVGDLVKAYSKNK